MKPGDYNDDYQGSGNNAYADENQGDNDEGLEGSGSGDNAYADEDQDDNDEGLEGSGAEEIDTSTPLSELDNSTIEGQAEGEENGGEDADDAVSEGHEDAEDAVTEVIETHEAVTEIHDAGSNAAVTDAAEDVEATTEKFNLHQEANIIHAGNLETKEEGEPEMEMNEESFDEESAVIPEHAEHFDASTQVSPLEIQII